MPNGDGITKALAVVRRIGKATPKIVGHALPIVSIGVNALSAWNEAGGDAENAGKVFLQSYIPVNITTGAVETKRLMSGLGSLLLSLGVGKLITWLGS